MDSFELNKIAGAVLFAVLIILGVQNLAGVIYATGTADANAYIVEGVETASAVASTNDAEAIAGAPSLAMLLAGADGEVGEKVARKCATCHTFDSGGANKVGPNLWNIIGHAVAAREGFSYSAAMVEFGGEWDYERLDDFLEAPKKSVPGTKMSFAGVRKPKDRANLIEYMRLLSDSPPPLPPVGGELQ
ncbi:MAG: cytochrome c family protein [Hyphomicrobiales bacterium]|nr:cytochrome c family protein [Hyphomicrobiales bacterium]MCY4048528.1 cytochrome c family protein [Hyphomicrobiales bacterium]